MASQLLSRFLPGLDGENDRHAQSESMFDHDIAESDQMDRFHDQLDDHELDNMLLDAVPASPTDRMHSSPSRSLPSSEDHSRSASSPHVKPLTQLHPQAEHDHDDVPESLLMEAGQLDQDSIRPFSDDNQNPTPPIAGVGPRLGPATLSERAGGPKPNTQTPTHISFSQQPHRRLSPTPQIDPREQAMWRWTNVTNVDGFLLQVYEYYIDHGIWSILLARSIRLLTTIFLFAMYIFLSTCVDFSKVPNSKSTKEILIKQCMNKTSFLKNLMIWLFSFWTVSTLFRYIADIRRLWHLHQFYHYLLDIPDSDIQTISWERVVQGLMDLRDSNPATAEHLPTFLRSATSTRQSKQRMDAHDIANRLMRRDNYYIAMIDKQIFDFSLPVPFLGSRTFYSKSLEWCIGFCFENFIFDQHGHVKQSCLDGKHRQRMISALRSRLRFAAVISVLMAPFNIGAHCIYYFSRYYAEFRNSPAQLGARAFIPLAEWKMREFNELDHDFRKRIKMAYPFADRYLNQFPKDKTNQAMQFVGLVTGTIAAILGIATLLDPELFLGFEVTPGRTAFFYLSISMAIFAATRSAAADDDEVHQPVEHLERVNQYTHYEPRSWKDQLHSNTVRAEFSELYQMKILIFTQELLSLIVAPFILWRNSGTRSAQIVDFFKQWTVNVDGLGGLCHYAVFEFRKRTPVPNLDTKTGKSRRIDGQHENEILSGGGGGGVNDEKMALSQFYFMQRLDHYDQQQQASRYKRHKPLTQPPAFPPLSALDEGGALSSSRAPPVNAAHKPFPVRLPAASPHQSLLLDFNQKRMPLGRSAHALGPDSRRASRRHEYSSSSSPPKHDNAQESGTEVPVHDMTTSRLIEADVDLADSWKLDNDRVEGGFGERAGSSSDATDVKRGNGVFDLLFEYSKAHTDRKRGGGMVS